MKINKSLLLSKFDSFKLCSKYKLWFVLPCFVILVALIVFLAIGGTTGDWSEGVNIGIDFEGGTIIQVKILQVDEKGLDDNYATQVANIRRAIESQGVKVSYVGVEEAANREDSAITFRYKNISEDDGAIGELNEVIRNSVSALYPGAMDEDPNFIGYESIGASASASLIEKAVIASVISLLLILIYIMIRFQPASAIAAIVALIHDVAIMFAMMIICRVQINSSFVAALITIIAYSINNTIIIFDRVRELMKPMKQARSIDYNQLGDNAVKNTVTRTIYSTFTTLVVIVVLAIMSGSAIQEFALPIIFGLIAGLYSSLFIATPLWCRMSYAYARYKEKKLAGTDAYVGKEAKSDTESTAQIATETTAENAAETEEPKQAEESETAPAQKKKSTGAKQQSLVAGYRKIKKDKK